MSSTIHYELEVPMIVSGKKGTRWVACMAHLDGQNYPVLTRNPKDEREDNVGTP